MCGRFTLRTPALALIEHFGVEPFGDVAQRFNIAPTQEVPAVRAEPEGTRQLALLHWGLIPSWAKEASIGSRLINARAETVAEKPAFRAAFRRRRCLVVADGFYEWKKVADKRQPFHIHLQDQGLLGFAGLWERWHSPENESEIIESCTIITTEANEKVRALHDRMPAIVAPGDYAHWLDPEFENRERLQTLLAPCPDDALEIEPVSTYVNNARHEGPSA